MEKDKKAVIKSSSAELAQRVVKVSLFLFFFIYIYLFFFFFYIILDVYNGLNITKTRLFKCTEHFNHQKMKLFR